VVRRRRVSLSNNFLKKRIESCNLSERQLGLTANSRFVPPQLIVRENKTNSTSTIVIPGDTVNYIQGRGCSVLPKVISSLDCFGEE